MSAESEDAQDILDRFLSGEIDADEFQDRIRELGPDTDRDALWARWAEQGLFDEPVERDEWVSRKNGQYRVIRDDG